MWRPAPTPSHLSGRPASATCWRWWRASCRMPSTSWRLPVGVCTIPTPSAREPSHGRGGGWRRRLNVRGLGASPRGMRNLIAVLVAILAGQPSDRLAAQSLSPRDSALHALNRLAYGPRPGDVDRVAAMGTLKWIDQQLDPDRLDDRVLAQRERAFSLLGLSREDLARTYLDAQRARRERQRNAGADSTMRQGADAADQTPERSEE